MDVKDWEYDGGGIILAFAGSVQLLWLLVALVVLPVEKASGRLGADGLPKGRRAVDAPTVDASIVAGSSTVGSAADTGSVSAAARATRVVLPAASASPDPRN
jgi:hypothetical protein